MSEHRGPVALGAEHPGAELGLVGAQVQDQVVKLAGHRQRPEAGALGGRRREVGRRAGPGAGPPVPGSTPSSGSSGSDPAEDLSSTSMMCSHASASSYPPPEAVPLTAAR